VEFGGDVDGLSDGHSLSKIINLAVDDRQSGSEWYYRNGGSRKFTIPRMPERRIS